MSNEINQAFKNSQSDVYNVANDIGLLYMQPELSDLTLIVNESHFPVHKVILAARCQYFRALLYGGLRESFENEIKLQEDTSDEAVEHVLKFIYRGSINVAEMNDKLILETLSLAHKYGLASVERQISAHLADGLCMANVVSVLNIAVLYEIKTLIATCLRYLDKNALDILQSDQMLRLSEHALIRLTSRDSFCAPETAIFEAVRRWLQEQDKEDHTQVIEKSVRLELMPLDALLGPVRESGLLEPNRILDAIKTTYIESSTSSDKPPVAHRGLVLPEENLARPQWGFSVIAGLIGSNGSTTEQHGEYDEFSQGFINLNSRKSQLSQQANPSSPMSINPTASTSSSSSACVVVKLGSPSKLNKVCIQLPEQSPRDTGPYRMSSNVSSSNMALSGTTSSGAGAIQMGECCCWLGGYTLEVGMDLSSWKTVVDYRRFCCRSWQTVYFESQVVQYLRISGCRQHNLTQAGVSSLTVLAIKCMYTDTLPAAVENTLGLLMPSYNVCLQEHHAIVVEGVSRTRNSLVNGDSQNYNWDTGYTCHQLGNGAIVVQMPQPYSINCIRFLLWDLDDRVYSYTVEVSVDRAKWSMVADKSMDMCSSVQTLFFSARPVVFIRIIGTYNSVNEVFHVVHIEASYAEEEVDNGSLSVSNVDKGNASLPPIVTHNLNTRTSSVTQVSATVTDTGPVSTIDLASTQPLFPNLPGNQQQRSLSITNSASNPRPIDDRDDDDDDDEDDLHSEDEDRDDRNSSF